MTATVAIATRTPAARVSGKRAVRRAAANAVTSQSAEDAQARGSRVTGYGLSVRTSTTPPVPALGCG